MDAFNRAWALLKSEEFDPEKHKGAFKLHPFAKPELTYEGEEPSQRIIDEGWWMYDAPAENKEGWHNIHLVYDPAGECNPGQFCSDVDPKWINYVLSERERENQ